MHAGRGPGSVLGPRGQDRRHGRGQGVGGGGRRHRLGARQEPSSRTRRDGFGASTRGPHVSRVRRRRHGVASMRPAHRARGVARKSPRRGCPAALRASPSGGARGGEGRDAARGGVDAGGARRHRAGRRGGVTVPSVDGARGDLVEGRGRGDVGGADPSRRVRDVARRVRDASNHTSRHVGRARARRFGRDDVRSVQVRGCGASHDVQPARGRSRRGGGDAPRGGEALGGAATRERHERRRWRRLALPCSPPVGAVDVFDRRVARRGHGPERPRRRGRFGRVGPPRRPGPLRRGGCGCRGGGRRGGGGSTREGRRVDGGARRPRRSRLRVEPGRDDDRARAGAPAGPGGHGAGGRGGEERRTEGAHGFRHGYVRGLAQLHVFRLRGVARARDRSAGSQRVERVKPGCDAR